jgi:hypothetical protein
MAILDALGAYLQTQGQGTLATDIFLARMPDTPDACVTLYENQGVGPDHTFGSSVKAIDHQRVRIYCRAARKRLPNCSHESGGGAGCFGRYSKHHFVGCGNYVCAFYFGTLSAFS